MKTIYLPRLYEISSNPANYSLLYGYIGLFRPNNGYRIINNTKGSWLIIYYGNCKEKQIKLKLHLKNKCYYIKCRENSSTDNFFNDNKKVQYDLIRFYQENNYLKTITIKFSPKLNELSNIICKLFKNEYNFEYKNILIQKFFRIDRDGIKITIGKKCFINISKEFKVVYLSKILNNEDKLTKIFKLIIFILITKN